MNLYPYQQIGADFLAQRKHALLADDMGLGKSAQAIAAAAALSLPHKPRIGVVCPASVQENWRREFFRFWPAGRGFNLMVTSYDKARADGVQTFGDRFDVLILDEAHYLKTATSKRTRAIFGEKCDGVGGLVERADRVWLLTGTPMPNNASELWPHLRALFPEAILSPSSGKPYSYWQFVSKFCKTRDNGFGTQIVGTKNHDKLRALLEPIMLRRLKVEVLPDLPDITFDNLYVEGRIGGAGGVAEAREYMLEADKIRRVLEKDGVEGLKALAGHVATLRRLTGLAKVAPVVEWVKDFLLGSDRKIVIFAQHTDVIKALDDGLDQFSPVIVNGSRTGAERQFDIDSFQNDPDCRVFIGQIQAAGTGITLTAASDVLFVESSWVPSDNAQAAARCHRIGSTRGVLVRFATLAGSIDEQIQRAVARKTADIASVLDAAA